jgi:hypothetical protein
MMNLKAKMTKAEDLGTNTKGEIHATAPDGGLRVSDVRTRRTRSSTFVLPPGSYEYRFRVSGGSGTYTIAIIDLDGDDTLASKEFDTDSGANQMVSFTVKP